MKTCLYHASELAPRPGFRGMRVGARVALVWWVCQGWALVAGPELSPPLPYEFTRMVAHWDQYSSPEYLDFVSEAQPELVQVGFYGAHFWSLVHTPEFGGYPAHFPVQGIKECGDWFRGLNRSLHAIDAKLAVIGHFNVEFLVGDPASHSEGPRGFFKWYRDDWDAAVLGPKPVEDPVDLLEKNADGTPITQDGYGIGGMGEYWGCLRNPAWREVLKAWLRHGVDCGLDGVVINYFYRHDCLCEHCQKGFRDHLRGRYSDEELREKFGIAELSSHRFEEIVSWHAPSETSPLRLEMLRFSQISNKQAFDEVFVRYGRELKEDLIVAQWNHLGDFGQISGDERCMLPADLWGRDESYLWYSTGGAANFTDLKNRFLGDATLQARYIRGAFGDRPFTLGKYESTRIRAAIAELAANGGAPMGFYTRFTDPEARAVIVAYYQFLKSHDVMFRGNRPHAEVSLVFPRGRVQRGDVAAVDRFRMLGRALLEAHVLFDIVPDDLLEEREWRQPVTLVTADADVASVVAQLPHERSVFEAPFTVQVSASRPAEDGREIDFHFVNYNRDEPPLGGDGKPSAGAGVGDEKPIAVKGIRASVKLPVGSEVESVMFISPDLAAETELEGEVDGGRLRFELPEFSVYGVARVLLK
jgi:hypothetical protein